jgi:hypothetical protein
LSAQWNLEQTILPTWAASLIQIPDVNVPLPDAIFFFPVDNILDR